jgi:serine/threonine protein kinase
MENKAVTRAMFIESYQGNIKEKYFFEKKLGSGGYGAVYLAKNKITGKSIQFTFILHPLFHYCRRKSCNQGYAKIQNL